MLRRFFYIKSETRIYKIHFVQTRTLVLSFDIFQKRAERVYTNIQIHIFVPSRHGRDLTQNHTSLHTLYNTRYNHKNRKSSDGKQFPPYQYLLNQFKIRRAYHDVPIYFQSEFSELKIHMGRIQKIQAKEKTKQRYRD